MKKNLPAGTKVYPRINETVVDTTIVCTIKEYKSPEESKDITGHYVYKEPNGGTREVRDWDVVAVPHLDLPEDEMIRRYLDDNRVDAEVSSTGGFLSVHIHWGDWKHDHLWSENLMKYIGYVRVATQVTEEDGSDTYSAVHVYKKSEMFDTYIKYIIQMYILNKIEEDCNNYLSDYE